MVQIELPASYGRPQEDGDSREQGADETAAGVVQFMTLRRHTMCLGVSLCFGR